MWTIGFLYAGPYCMPHTLTHTHTHKCIADQLQCYSQAYLLNIFWMSLLDLAGIEKPVIEKKQQPIIDGKAHAAMFDPLKSVKSEADSTLSSETKPDPFADIGEQYLDII